MFFITKKLGELIMSLDRKRSKKKMHSIIIIGKSI